MPNSTLPRGSAKGTSGGKAGSTGGVTTFNGQVGDVVFTGGSIPPESITYAQIQNETASTLLGNPDTLAGSPSEVTLGAQLGFTLSVLNTAGISATITTAKLTGGGTNGSMTFTEGVLTSQTPAT
jgi:hypothetical protein